MNLYGSQSNAEAFCNFSIPCTGSKESGELELSFCELSDSMKNICRIRFAAAPAEVKVYAVGDGLNEPLVIDGLLDEIYGAFLESRDGQINVAVPVMKMTGRSIPLAERISCASIPLMLGMRMSSMTQPGSEGTSPVKNCSAVP